MSDGYAALHAYFRGVSFTPQAMAFEPKSRKVLGRIGVESVLKGVVRINNFESLKKFIELSGDDTPGLALKSIVNSGFKNGLTSEEDTYLNLLESAGGGG